MKEICVGMGELQVGFEDNMLMSVGLGSCIAVIIFDISQKIGGMAHVLLPDSRDYRDSEEKKSVIIAERDTGVRNHIRNMLINHDFDVIAETWEKGSAISLCQQLKPDVSLVSAFLPPGNGVDFVHELIKIDGSASAIVLSPKIDRQSVCQYIHHGFKDVIINPFTEQKVLSSVSAITNKKKMRYADQAIPTIVGSMINHGAIQANLRAKLVGGAHMFPTIVREDILNIGRRNIEQAKETLHKMGIPIVAEDTGAHIGRTVMFYPATGRAVIKTKNGTTEI